MILSDPVQVEKQEQEALGLARHLGEMMAKLPESSLHLVSPIVADHLVIAFSAARNAHRSIN